jgi:GT2 family glycosyltransferase
MKIHYIKSNSERNEAFGLQTIIYEEKGRRYVKKHPLGPKAKAHFKNLRSSREQLEQTIQNPSIKLVPLVEDKEEELIFSYIEGESFEEKLRTLKSEEEIEAFLRDYFDLLKSSFSIQRFDAAKDGASLVSYFGERDYSYFDGKEAFEKISNIDLILSNLIEQNGTIYIIDYEWSLPANVPLSFVLYRTISQLDGEIAQKMLERFDLGDQIFEEMERHFIDRYVMKDGFYHYRHNYMKINLPLKHYLEEKEKQIVQLKNAYENLLFEHERVHKELNDAYEKLDSTGMQLAYAQELVAYRDLQLEAARLKNRLMRLIGKLVPTLRPPELPPPPTPPELKKRTPKYTYSPPPKPSQEEIDALERKPLISILMPVYNVDPKWLQKAVESVKNQWYDNWELCIVDDKSTNQATIDYLKSLDDPRIKVKFSEVNKNIAGASNEAAKMATGEYIALLDHDDELTPDALYEMVKAINETDADFLYSDEDFIDTEGNCSNPHFKPDFSPDLLMSHNYITHLACFRKDLFDEVGGFDERFSGSQDYDLFLKLTEKTDRIVHIPKVLYHWRTIEGSTSADSKAKPQALEISKKVLEEALRRRGIDGWVEPANLDHYFRVRYKIKGEPLVSIVIPFKDKPGLLEMCLDSILKKSTYKNFEIIGISNNSEDPKTFEVMERYEKLDPRIRFYEYNIPFNYAAINNYAVERYAKGEHVLLLNNDIEVITPDWIEAMLEHSQRPEIGCVGAKLYYPNDTVQHAGIIMGLGGYAGHSHKHHPRESLGYFNRLNVIQNVSAVTGACLMVKKNIYKEVGGMDEQRFKVAYNDVDFCLRVMEAGYRNLFTPYAEMYHHESVSRGYETTPEKQARFQKEKDALYARHQEILTKGDPYYNPNLTHDKEDFSICPKR